jgi:hypothetical protein
MTQESGDAVDRDVTAPGTDFTNIRFRPKFFGQNLTLKFGTKFPPKITYIKPTISEYNVL